MNAVTGRIAASAYRCPVCAAGINRLQRSMPARATSTAFIAYPCNHWLTSAQAAGVLGRAREVRAQREAFDAA